MRGGWVADGGGGDHASSSMLDRRDLREIRCQQPSAAQSTPPSPGHEFQDSQVSQVAAMQRGGGRGGRAARNFRGGGRGQRGGRYNNNQGQRNNQNQSTGPKPHQKGPKASPDVPSSACARHWKEGKNATYCSDPLVCEWVNFVKPCTSNNSTSN